MLFGLLLNVAFCSQLSFGQPCDPNLSACTALKTCCNSYEFEQRISYLENITGTHVDVLATGMTIESFGTLTFPTVEMNIGGGYNIKTGIFRAPVSGVYYVAVTLIECSVHLTASKNKEKCFILKNGIKEVELFSELVKQKWDTAFQMTTTLSVQLNKDDYIVIGRCLGFNSAAYTDRKTTESDISMIFHLYLRYNT